MTLANKFAIMTSASKQHFTRMTSATIEDDISDKIHKDDVSNKVREDEFSNKFLYGHTSNKFHDDDVSNMSASFHEMSCPVNSKFLRE